MLGLILEFLFITSAILLALTIIYGKLFVFKKRDAVFVSDYCAGIAMFLVLYVILAFACTSYMPTVFAQFIMVGFGLSPFILGLLANYHTEKYFTVVQLCLICTSIWYAWT